MKTNKRQRTIRKFPPTRSKKYADGIRTRIRKVLAAFPAPATSSQNHSAMEYNTAKSSISLKVKL